MLLLYAKRKSLYSFSQVENTDETDVLKIALSLLISVNFVGRGWINVTN